MEPYCDGTQVRARVRDGHVTFIIRDSAAVSELFGLRPEVATAYVWIPGMQQAAQSPVRVTYVDPQIPLPDSAFRAAVAEERRRHFRSVHRASRGIATELPRVNLWLVAGDSAAMRVSEGRCRYTTCVVSAVEAPDARWSVADTSIAVVRTNGSGPRVVALRPGRTVLRAAGLPASNDTMYVVPEEVEREVVVTLPVASVRICPRGPVYTDSPFPLHVEVVDSGGNVFLDPPVIVRMNNAYELTPSDTAEVQFSGGRGTHTLTTAFAGHADTLELRVHLRAMRSRARPVPDADKCSPSALPSALPVARRPDE